MRVKTSELEGAALDWAVAKAIGCGFTNPPSMVPLLVHPANGYMPLDEWSPSTDWSQGGPLIEQFRIELDCHDEYDNGGNIGPIWEAVLNEYSPVVANGYDPVGKTPLFAACRSIVIYRLGSEVDIPDELLNRAA